MIFVLLIKKVATRTLSIDFFAESKSLMSLIGEELFDDKILRRPFEVGVQMKNHKAFKRGKY